ncbi:hypothetical protein PHSY_003999 [Pseudozyma hubeiensis SY62]|uniref:CCHC-type domain-containing protein n=1 Tax=Pseudozyma hubeiensis (strain SY62) TaxID=1305764 RepID=R9P536_PSEHS|nr:hypothetical protein PHSY_003999 [Pseudozyma hubeiensis SY62]GAC96419.1 hypothetical protein PHSY_003999 [Pseudozyma hubeiensis SY62]
MSSPASSDCSLESGEWNDEDQSFYFDTRPTPYECFDPDQSFEGYQHILTTPRVIQGASGAPSTAEPLGSIREVEEQAQHAQQQRVERHCFNCGEGNHAVAQCRHPKDPERIRRSRLEFNESKAGCDDDATGDMNAHARLHEQIAWVEQRLRWLDEFVPGKPSPALIDALSWPSDGDSREDGYGGSAANLPYLHRMLLWGYPPGWVSSEDPIEQVRQRIQVDSQWSSLDVLGGFDVAPLGASQRHTSAEISAKTAPDGNAGTKPRRWVDYRTDLFDSQRLQTFDTSFRAPLPKMPKQKVNPLPTGRDQPGIGRRSPSSRGVPQTRIEGASERSRKTEEEDRAALWNRLLSERSPSPPDHHVARESRRAPAHIDRHHPYASPSRSVPAPPPPSEPAPLPPSPPPPAPSLSHPSSPPARIQRQLSPIQSTPM